MHQKISTGIPSPLVRQARPEDFPAIHALVRELAVYEKAPDKVSTTPESYLADYQAGYFDVIVAETCGVIVGIAVYYKAFSTWRGRMMYLEDFIVTESYRRTGLGKLLFEAFLDKAREAESILCKLQVLRWNEPAINFYRKYDPVFDDEWVDVKLYLRAV
jgi:GNAT superfamily N-acetyltransferase